MKRLVTSHRLLTAGPIVNLHHGSTYGGYDYSFQESVQEPLEL